MNKVKDKLTDLMKLKRKRQVDIAPVYGMSKNSFNNKLGKASTRFNIEDLIKLAEITDTTLAFIDNGSGKVLVQFDPSDIQETL